MGNVNGANVALGGGADPFGNADPGNGVSPAVQAANAVVGNNADNNADDNRPTLLDRVSSAKVHACVNAVLEHARLKRRKFVETVEISMVLNDWASLKKKGIKGTYTFKHLPRIKFRLCVLGDKKHCQEARAAGIDCMDRSGINTLQKSSKLVKKLANKYNVFLASPSICHKVPRIMGPWLHRIGKAPILLTHKETLASKVEKVKRTIRFEMNKSPVVGFVIGNVRLTADQLEENFEGLVNHLLILLPNGWADIRSVDIKSSMGPAQRVYSQC
ncbi:hypothetical protein HPB48_020794 [Haemaphysalis longicornis]|uniref:Ribosomal protein n=1 Tax=Haemaphysalis longicornis TaxID=44386 RepID=A0A9J6H2B3_HAELO|nr:hypothetical protein HPB48_020794 [Haemaphysalis longicornis]